MLLDEGCRWKLTLRLSARPSNKPNKSTKQGKLHETSSSHFGSAKLKTCTWTRNTTNSCSYSYSFRERGERESSEPSHDSQGQENCNQTALIALSSKMTSHLQTPAWELNVQITRKHNHYFRKMTGTWLRPRLGRPNQMLPHISCALVLISTFSHPFLQTTDPSKKQLSYCLAICLATLLEKQKFQPQKIWQHSCEPKPLYCDNVGRQRWGMRLEELKQTSFQKIWQHSPSLAGLQPLVCYRMHEPHFGGAYY